MSAPSSLPGWQLPPPPIVDVLRADEDIEDIVTLSGAAAPDWLKRLSIPTDWQLVRLPEGREQALTRVAVCGPIGDGEWEAADTISVSGFTGTPGFYDVFRNADRVLRDLDANGVSVKALPVPPLQWTAAVRSSGMALIGERRVWIQQSNYVAGSDRPHQSRLIVHTTLATAESRERLAESISQLTADVYRGFVDAVAGTDAS